MNDTRKTDEFGAGLLAARSWLRRYALSLCGNANDADDLVQETICRAITYRDKFDGTNLNGWLSTILLNFFRAERRRGWQKTGKAPEGPRVLYTDDKHYADRIVAPGDPESDLIVREELLRFARMKAKFFDTLSGLAIGHSYEDVAIMTGVPVGTVKSRVNRARALLAAT